MTSKKVNLRRVICATPATKGAKVWIDFVRTKDKTFVKRLNDAARNGRYKPELFREYAGKPEDATRHSGYLVGGCSPFGTRKPMPVCVERSVLALPRLYLNGGSFNNSGSTTLSSTYWGSTLSYGSGTFSNSGTLRIGFGVGELCQGQHFLHMLGIRRTNARHFRSCSNIVIAIG